MTRRGGILPALIKQEARSWIGKARSMTTPRSRARKLAIVEAAVPEYVSETREGMDNIADAIRTLAGVMSSVAAAAHTDTLGNQRNMAGVIYADAQARFSDVLRKLDDKTQKDLESWLAGLCKSRR